MHRALVWDSVGVASKAVTVPELISAILVSAVCIAKACSTWPSGVRSCESVLGSYDLLLGSIWAHFLSSASVMMTIPKAICNIRNEGIPVGVLIHALYYRIPVLLA